LGEAPWAKPAVLAERNDLGGVAAWRSSSEKSLRRIAVPEEGSGSARVV